MKNELEVLQDYLKTINVNSEVKSVLQDYDFNCLEWETQYGWRNRVYNGSILIIHDEIRAFQEERFNDIHGEVYEYSLVILNDSKQEFKWDLVQIDRDESRFDCLYLGEHNDSIIHIHKHALHTTILSYRNEILKRFHCESELINRKGDIISFERVQKVNRKRPVELIELPELTKLNSLTHEESEDLSLRPTGNFPIGFLNNK